MSTKQVGSGGGPRADRARRLAAFAAGVALAVIAHPGAAEPPQATPPLDVGAIERMVSLPFGMEILEDPDDRFSIAALAAGAPAEWGPPPSTWIRDPAPGSVFARGRLVLPDRDAAGAGHFLTFGWPFVEDAQVALVQEGRVVWQQEAGALRPFDDRPYPDRRLVFPIPDAVEGEATLYLRVRNERVAFLFVELWDGEAFVRSAGNVDYFMGACIGLTVALALYNFFIFLSTRERSYLYYTGFVVLGGLWLMTKNGYAYRYLWPELPEWNQDAQLVLSGLARAFAGAFAGRLLELRSRAPAFDKINRGFVAASVASATIALTGGFEIAYGLEMILGLTQFPVMLALGSVVWWRGARYAGYFVLGWLALATSLVVMLLSATGVLPWTDLATWGIEVGGAVEAVLFSLALAARISDLQSELRDSNVALSGYRDELERRVAERTEALVALQREMVEMARAAGKAEVASGVLHDVGNALNSAGVSIGALRARLADSRASRLRQGVELLTAHRHELGRWVEHDEQGRVAIDYLDAASAELEAEHRALSDEVEDLSRAADHVAEIVAAQQRHAASPSLAAPHAVSGLLEDAIAIAGGSGGWSGVELRVAAPSELEVVVDRHRVVQILVNLLLNARQATERAADRPSHIDVTATIADDGERVAIEVTDDGDGIGSEDVDRIFQFGFTTRDEGSGFGLHSAANTAADLGGRIEVTSEGRSRGATFRLLLPLRAPGAARVADQKDDPASDG